MQPHTPLTRGSAGTPDRHTGARRRFGRRPLVALAASALAAGALAGPGVGAAAAAPVNASNQYSFATLDNAHDLTFNQLLGINNEGLIAGYFGSGTPANVHPNKGYTL